MGRCELRSPPRGETKHILSLKQPVDKEREKGVRGFVSFFTLLLDKTISWLLTEGKLDNPSVETDLRI